MWKVSLEASSVLFYVLLSLDKRPEALWKTFVAFKLLQAFKILQLFFIIHLFSPCEICELCSSVAGAEAELGVFERGREASQWWSGLS